MKHFILRHLLSLLVCVSLIACAQEDSIFPAVDTSLAEADIVLPNPIGLHVNAATSQLYVVNSNVDFFSSGSTLTVLTIDATDVAAPVLTATQQLVIPNFAGQSFFDGTDALFIPFRESSAADPDLDTFRRYRLSDGEFAEDESTTIADDPYGLTFVNDHFYIVSEETLSIFDTSLTLEATIDLTTAEDADISDAGAKFVEASALNADATKALVTNRDDNLFVVDLQNAEVVQVVDGPVSTRDLLVDGNDPSRVYVIDSNAQAVLVFDFDLLPTSAAIPESIDDSEILVASVGVGQDPNGLLLDAANHRLYVCNSFDDTISVIDTLSLTELARVSLNAADLPSAFVRDIQDPLTLALGEINGESYLFVAGLTSNSLAMLRTTTLEVVLVYPNNDLYFIDDPDDEDN